MINKKNIEEIFKALDRQIGVYSNSPMSLVVCGGSALFALGLVLRTTKDVDVLGEAIHNETGMTVKKIDEFPEWFIKAAKVVQRDFGLPEAWINLGPASQVESGLPAGFEKRLIKRQYGRYLTVYFISRFDQIHFKLYAAVDRDEYHVDDLFALKPTEQEMDMATRWVLTQDVSEGFKLMLKDFLRKKGYNDIAQKI